MCEGKFRALCLGAEKASWQGKTYAAPEGLNGVRPEKEGKDTSPGRGKSK